MKNAEGEYKKIRQIMRMQMSSEIASDGVILPVFDKSVHFRRIFLR